MNRIPMLLLSAAMLCLPMFATGAQADILYASTNPTNTPGDFGTLDTVTGVYTPLGDNGVALAGIGTENGILYGMARNTASGILYSINTTNGALTPIGNSNITILDFTVVATGLWAIGTNGNLYRIDPNTGAATLSGNVGPLAATPTVQNWNSLGGIEGIVFDVLDNLYTLNQDTAGAHFLGCGGSFPFGDCSGPQMGAMGATGGVLYGVDNPTFGLYSVDIISNAITDRDTFITSITGATGAFNGLSTAPVVVTTPEPITLSVFGAGLFGALTMRRRRKTN